MSEPLIEPITGRYMRLDVDGRPCRLYWEEAGADSFLIFFFYIKGGSSSIKKKKKQKNPLNRCLHKKTNRVVREGHPNNEQCDLIPSS